MDYILRLPQPHETSGVSQPSVLVRKRIRDELRGRWLEDKDFFKKFFPVDAGIRKAASKAKIKAYNELVNPPRWTRVPSDPKALNSRLYSGLNNLLNIILCDFMLDQHNTNRRLFIQTYRRKVLPNLKRPIWPAILLAGSDIFFIRRDSARPVADYRSGISPLEVILEGANMEVALGRLATMVQAIFEEQPTRRFVFGLVISAASVTCCHFDHSGILTSPPLDYHRDPDQFCALISGLASTKSSRIGLDTSAFFTKDYRVCIGTRDPTRKHRESDLYFLTKKLYHVPRMMGRGTTCYLAHREDDTETKYVIKDAWISADDTEFEGRDSEAALLCHVKEMGITKGVAQISHFEDVRIPDDDGKLLIDNVYNNRRLKPSEYSSVPQRVHTRIIMTTYGKPLEEFSTRKELLLAFYDAVRAHRNIYEQAGILHRDIKPGNILINPEGEDGSRGIIIDFDHAIRVEDTSPYSKKLKIGTHLFMSINVLEGKTQHGYLDDLESFYYVLLYIIIMFTGPHAPVEKMPFVIESWQRLTSSKLKLHQFIEEIDELGIQPWFGNSFRQLVERLRSFFATRLIKSRRKQLSSVPSPTQDAEEFISYIVRAISELEGEESTLESSPERSSGHVDTPVHTLSKRRRPTMIRDTLAAVRDLRPDVNYGRHKNL